MGQRGTTLQKFKFDYHNGSPAAWPQPSSMPNFSTGTWRGSARALAGFLPELLPGLLPGVLPGPAERLSSLERAATSLGLAGVSWLRRLCPPPVLSACIKLCAPRWGATILFRRYFITLSPLLLHLDSVIEWHKAHGCGVGWST